MATRFDLVTIDSPDTERLARFWCAVLPLHEIEREDGDRWIVLGEMDGTRRIGLQRGDHRPGGVHLDLVCDIAEFDTERRRLVQVGATEVGAAREEPYGRIANLADPDGNLFDLCAYEPSA
jgi:predicted enzyme related to lactoylglutathione lyase